MSTDTFVAIYRLPLFAIMLLVAGSGLVTGCDSSDNRPTRPFFETGDRGTSRFDLAALRDRLNTLPREAPGDQEKASLRFLREEEKLARDVYRTLYNEWEVRALDNIASSEDTHTSAVRLLLNRYGISDPVVGQPDGSFSNSDLQALHDSLVTAGQESEVEALKVGAAVEEIDLIDLNEDLDTFVDNEDITLVYENLAKGSRNHLRAFTRALETRGIDYDPQYLDEATYQSIIENGMEQGSS